MKFRVTDTVLMFRTRREQIKEIVLKEVVPIMRKRHKTWTRADTARLIELARSAALCASAEERGRTLDIIREHRTLVSSVCSVGIMEVLGWGRKS